MTNEPPTGDIEISGGRPSSWWNAAPPEPSTAVEPGEADAVAAARDAAVDAVRPYRDGIEGVAQALAHEAALDALIAVASARTAAPVEGEALAAFACPDCQPEEPEADAVAAALEEDAWAEYDALVVDGTRVERVAYRPAVIAAASARTGEERLRAALERHHVYGPAHPDYVAATLEERASRCATCNEGVSALAPEQEEVE